jgi:hypothetical protein
MAVVAVGVGAVEIARREGPDRPPLVAAPAQPTAAAPITTDLPPTTVPSAPCVVLSGATTGPGACVEPVRVAGTTVLVGDRRFEVGRPGDVVVLGDWDCDGGATPAVLRPDTGEVFVFNGWAAAAHPVAVPSSGRVAGAKVLLVEEADGCAVLLAERADGSRLAVATERRA